MLRAYRAGLFPMAESRGGDRLYWLDPERRGIMPLDAGFHLPRGCCGPCCPAPMPSPPTPTSPASSPAAPPPRPGREDTWINPEIEGLFIALHRMGHAHSVEVWEGDRLVGGLYGVVLGAAFFGESMFSRARDASKVALVQLVARLRLGGFTLLDSQFLTDHLAQFGAHEIPRADYKRRLAAAVMTPADWISRPYPAMLEAEIRALRASGEA